MKGSDESFSQIVHTGPLAALMNIFVGLCRRSGLLVVVLVALVLPSAAEVVKVRDFNLSAPRDRNVLFDMALTPSGDVLSFIAKNTGEWQLYRVRNWLDSRPLEDKLFLAGFFSKKDRPDTDGPTARVFVTADGAYAVCIGSAEWTKWVRGRAAGVRSDDVISVVDLTTFKAVAATRTRAFGLFEIHDVRLDREGHVLVETLSFDGPKRGAFVQLALPSLTPGPRCSYDWIRDPPIGEHPQPSSENECRQLLKSMTLQQYLDKGLPSFASNTHGCEGNHAEFCHLYTADFTADGKFGVAVHTEGHDTLFGGWAETQFSYVIFSTAKLADIGEIKEPTNDAVEKALTSIGGHDYLLVLRGGRHLDVFELRD